MIHAYIIYIYIGLRIFIYYYDTTMYYFHCTCLCICTMRRCVFILIHLPVSANMGSILLKIASDLARSAKLLRAAKLASFMSLAALQKVGKTPIIYIL